MKNIPEVERKKIKFLHGHISFGVDEYLPNSSIYITMLRNPVERIISHYYYVLRNPNHYLYDQVVSQNMNLKDYVSSGISEELQNDQTRRLSGIFQKSLNSEQNPTDMLEIAKINLKEKIGVFGLTEIFDESLLLFQRKIGFQDIFYFKQNSTKNRTKKQDIPENVIQTIKDNNQLDIELYQYASDLFDSYITQESIKNKLQSFKILNSIYRHLHITKKKLRTIFS